MDPSGGGGGGLWGYNGTHYLLHTTSHLSLSWTLAPHTSDGMIWPRPGISSRLAITFSVILLQISSGDSALVGERGEGGGGAAECTDLHISAAVENIQVCKPRPVIVTLPWPNNTNVQQVKVGAVKHPE